jgi:OOP family OmpA-OmpF porin
MKKQLTTALIASLFISTNAFALSADQALSDTRGDVIKDQWGDCIATHDGLDTCNKPVIKALSLGADAFFDFNKATLKPAGIAKLDQLAIDLKGAGKVDAIDLGGHTDSVGSVQYNLRLSERRVHAVEAYIISKGVNPAIITAKGYGKSNPVADNATAEGRAQNRRVDIKITATAFKSTQ